MKTRHDLAWEERMRAAGVPAVRGFVEAGKGAATLAALAATFRRHRVLAGAVFALTLLAAAVVAFRMPRKYEAEMRILVKQDRLDGLIQLERGAAVVVSDESRLTSEIELLRSQDLIEKAVVQCGLSAGADRRELALAVQELQASLKIAPVGKTHLISVKYRDREPERAAKVLQVLEELYLQKHVAVRSVADSAGFFEEQTAQFRAQLDAAQIGLAKFQDANRISILPQQKSALLGRVVQLEAMAEETESQFRTAEERVKLLARQRETLPGTIESSSRVARNTQLIERLKGQLVDLENRRIELLGKYAPTYRAVVDVDKQMEQVRAAIEREQAPVVVDQTRSVNPLRQSVENDLLQSQAQVSGLRARQQVIARDLAQARAEQRKLEALTGDHDDLERKVKLAEENLVLYQKKREEVRLSDALNRRNILSVNVVQQAAIPALPANDFKGIVLGLGLMAAMMLASAAAILAEYFLPAPAPHWTEEELGDGRRKRFRSEVLYEPERDDRAAYLGNGD